MPEIKKPIKYYEVSYICDKCGKGKMVSNGICYTSNPPQYSHTCDHCGYSETYNGKSYPHVVYDDDEDEIVNLRKKINEYQFTKDKIEELDMVLSVVLEHLGFRVEG